MERKINMSDNNVANQLVPVAPSSVVPPNSDVPLRNSLTDLTLEELAGAVISTYFYEDYMRPLVTVNTIIWQNWDEIFSERVYQWEVVLKHPEWVKMKLISKTNCFICRPHKKDKTKYEALFLSPRGDIKKNLSKKVPVSLKEAVKLCEKCLYYSKYSSQGYERNSSPIDCDFEFKEYDEYYYLPKIRENVQKYSLEALKTLGLSDDYLNYIKYLNSYKYTYFLFTKLNDYVEPTEEDVKSVFDLYNRIDILTKGDINFIKKHNSPKVLSLLLRNDFSSVSFDVSNFSGLSPDERSKRLVKAKTVLEG